MNIAVPLRHRRLLLLCILSAAFHLLLLALVTRHAASIHAVPSSESTALAIRLVRSPSKPPEPAAQPRSAAPPASVPRAMRPPESPSSAPPAAAEPGLAAVAPPTAAPREAPVASPDAPVPAAPEASEPDIDQEPPQRYRVRMPAAIRLSYALTRRDGGGEASSPLAAVLDWRTDGNRYTLRMDGVLGRWASSGSAGDAGIEPESATEDTGERRLVTTFDAARRLVQFADGSAGGTVPGIQDPASFLMQLVGIGLARPDQVRDVVRVAVAGPDHLRVERFRVVGDDQIETPIGALSAVHLAQLAPPGAPRLDIWLAPTRDWLPVMLRVTGSDGSSATQVVSKIEAGTAP